jgi:predicted NUDIX family NTP pyrophosphohydrolase
VVLYSSAAERKFLEEKGLALSEPKRRIGKRRIGMAKIEIRASNSNYEALQLVRGAIESKMARIRLGLEITQKKLAKFEAKYQVSSEKFISEMAAEDLFEGDMEYVEWAGEYRILQKLKKDLERLEAVEYADK